MNPPAPVTNTRKRSEPAHLRPLFFGTISLSFAPLAPCTRGLTATPGAAVRDVLGRERAMTAAAAAATA